MIIMINGPWKRLISTSSHAARVCTTNMSSADSHPGVRSSSNDQQIFAFEKSISGCCSINFFSMSCLFCSSDVGLFKAFCL